MTPIERHGTASPYEPIVGYCRVVRAANHVFVGGTAPVAADGSNVEGDAQARRCLAVIIEALAKVGAGPERPVWRVEIEAEAVL